MNIGSDTYPDTMTHNAFNIGKAMAGYGYGDVDVSDVRVYNSTITDAQAKEIYDNPEQSIPTGFSSTNLILHLPMTEGAGSVVYNANAGAIGTELISNAGFDETCQKWGTTDDSTVEIAGGKAIWTNAPLSGSFVEQPLDLEAGKFYRVSFDYTSTMFNIFVNLGDTQQAVPLGNGRYTYDMYYGTGNKSIKFQHGWTTSSSASVDNVSVKEVVPNYYNGTINGATWVSGLPEPLPQTALMDWNKYQRWTGSQMATVVSSTIQTVKHSFYARVSLETANTDTNLGSIIFMNYATTGTILSIKHNRTVQLRPHCSTNGSVNVVGSTLNLGEVYDIVGVIDGSKAKIYVNGILDAELAHAQVTAPQGQGRIGSWSSTDFGAAFDGIIHQVAYFDRALTSEEIVDFYLDERKPQDLSDCVHSWRNLTNWVDDKQIQNATLTGTPSYVISQGNTGKDVYRQDITNPRASGAYNFDGNSWAEVQDNASLDITDAVTLEVWCYPTVDGTVNGRDLIGKYISSSSPYQSWAIEYQNQYFSFGIGATDNTWTVLSSSTSKTIESWYHVVGTYDGATRKIYVNGIEENSSAFTKTPKLSDLNVAIGRWLGQAVGGANTFFGKIANPRIYNYALTAQQVADNFNEKASTFGGTKVASELDAYIERTASDGATVEAHSCLVNYLTELDKK